MAGRVPTVSARTSPSSETTESGSALRGATGVACSSAEDDLSRRPRPAVTTAPPATIDRGSMTSPRTSLRSERSGHAGEGAR